MKIKEQAVKVIAVIGLAVIAVIAFAALLDITGCAARAPVNASPAVVSAVTLLDAENTVNTIAHGLEAANGLLTNIRETEPDYYVYARPLLVNLARQNDAANAAILAAKNGGNADWRLAVTAVGKTLTTPQALTTFGFKNSNSQALVLAGFATLESALALTAQYAGGK